MFGNFGGRILKASLEINPSAIGEFNSIASIPAKARIAMAKCK